MRTGRAFSVVSAAGVAGFAVGGREAGHVAGGQGERGQWDCGIRGDGPGLPVAPHSMRCWFSEVE